MSILSCPDLIEGSLIESSMPCGEREHSAELPLYSWLQGPEQDVYDKVCLPNFFCWMTEFHASLPFLGAINTRIDMAAGTLRN